MTNSPTDSARSLTGKGERTRARILDTALALIRERGFHETTMRDVASEAGVSLGNAYYYFRSKEHLIQEYYARSHRDHLEACAPILASETDLQARLRGVLDAKIATSQPYHRCAGTLFRAAADPQSPLNPFSPESGPTRREATALMAQVVEGSDTRVPDDLARELPGLLWLYLMGILLVWIHDDSPACRRTDQLIEHTSRMVTLLIRLVKNPLLRPLQKATLRLLEDLRDEPTPPAGCEDSS